MTRTIILTILLMYIRVLAGCAGDEPVTDAASEISLPPSVQAAPEFAVETVRLDGQQAGELDIETVRVSLSEDRYPLSMPGTVLPAPDNIAIVSAPISGRVERIFAHEGESVRRGEALLELESLEFAGLVADYLMARADQTYSRQQVERLQILVDKKISPRSALEKASADVQRTTAAVRASTARLKTLGVTDDELEAWLQGEDSRPVLVIRAPIGGVINDHNIDLGQAVTAYDRLLSLIDLSQVMVRGYVSPEDAILIKQRDPVEVHLREFPDRRLRTEVTTINPALDEDSRSVAVNIITASTDGWLVPGQHVRVEVLVAPPEPVLTVPLSAVEFEGDRASVFVRTDIHTYQRRSVTLGRVGVDVAAVTSGLQEGEEVAVTQVFSLKALGRYEQYAEE